MTKTTNTAEAQGMNTETTASTLTTKDALAFVIHSVGVQSKATLMTICSMVVYMIAAKYRDTGAVSLDKAVEELKRNMTEKGFKKSSMYVYIATARKLLDRMAAKHQFGGYIHDILVASNPGKAAAVVRECVEKEAYQKDKLVKHFRRTDKHEVIFSLDILRVNLGMESLKKANARAGNTPAETPAQTPATPAQPAPVEQSILETAIAQPGAVKKLKPKVREALTTQLAEVVGQRQFFLKAIATATAADCKAYIAAINERLAQLAKDKADHDGQSIAQGEPGEGAQEVEGRRKAG